MPAGYLAAEFLENQNNAYIQFSAPFNDAIGICVCQSQDSSNVDAAAINARPQDSRFYSPYMFNGNWYIGWNTWDVIKQYENEEIGKKSEVKLNYFNDRKASVKNSLEHFSYELTKTLPDAGSAIFSFFFYAQGGRFFKGRVYHAKMTEDNRIIRDFIPCINEAGKPCFYEKKSGQPFYARLGEFIVGLTLKQALQLSKLPSTGGELTVSLPWEAQLIASGVPDALQAAADKGWTITVQYREPEADNAYYNKYAECVTVADMAAVNPDYKHDLTADGAWIYPLPKLQNAEMAFASMRCKSAKFYMPELVRGRRIFQLLSGKSTTYAESVEVYAPKLILKSNYYEGVEIIFLEARIRELKVEFSPATTYISKDFAIFGLQNFEMNEMPNLTGLPGAFQNAELNKTSILRLIEQLPTWESGTHPATFGIHTDLQTDEEVIEAIINAETKGWTLVVQWNGTATAQTASTFGLRRPTIYAKLGTVARPDGTTENVLDWGHYVTDWEANGYQEFASVEEAKEYFNIIDEA